MPISRPHPTGMQLYHQALVRTPAMAANATMADAFELLKELISDASADFHHQIDAVTADQLDHIDDKKRFTLWKYFNRSKYRPVPFARFASVAIAPVSPQVSPSPLVVQKQVQVSVFANWEFADTLQPAGSKWLRHAAFLIANATIYRLGNSYRYLYQKDKTSYLGEVDTFSELEAVLSFCHSPQRKEAVFHHLHDHCGLNATQIQRLINKLLVHQLLYTDNMPNITGEDFFLRIGAVPGPDTLLPYLIAKRRVLSGSVSSPDTVQLPEVIAWLNRHLPVQEYRSLDAFRNAFIKRFDRRSMPLAEALDPELGVGYAGLATQGDNSSFPVLDQIFHVEPGISQSPPLNALLTFIVSRSGHRVVRLEDFRGDSHQPPQNIPNTLSMIGYPHSGDYVIEHLGGCTANALLGRFTLNDAEITSMCRSLAQIEQEANPGVTFFDVSYPAEKRVDNINRRERIFNQELPLFCWSTHPSPLQLSDIYIRIEGSEIVLFSIKNGERLVPRIATAYNYTRSDLALYRFLSDLQHQGLRTDLTLALRWRCPGLDHYPRVYYKNLILSPETWILPRAVRQGMALKPGDIYTDVVIWLRSLNLTRGLFKCGTGDQTLIFSLSDTKDMDAFMAYCKNQASAPVYIEEVLAAAGPGVIDERGDSYLGQYILSYFHQKQVYAAPLALAKQPDNESLLARNLLPGSDWLYLEIYCHPARANEILIQHLHPILRMKNQQIKKWFFVRYNTDGTHLRIRIHLNDAAQSSDLLTSIQQIIHPLMTQGLVKDMQIKTYQRELERYGIDLIEKIEECFCRDTQLVIRQLARNQQPELLYHQTLGYMYALISGIFPQPDRQIDFTRMMADQFSIEFNLNTASLKIINGNYREIKKQLMQEASALHFSKADQCVLTLLQSVAELSRQKALLADLMHMHLNRLFPLDQRKHEAVLYQLLLKDILRRQHTTVLREG